MAFTGDGGLNWERLQFRLIMVKSNFIDPNIGFILVGRGVAAGSSAVDIYSTVDGGRNWIAVYQMQPGVGDEINSLPFSGQKSGLGVLDAMNIWVSGNIPMESFVYLYVSHDGGYTWAKQELLLPEAYGSSMTEVMPPQFFENGYGILPIRLYGTNTAYAFYLSDDGGLSWSPGGAADFERKNFDNFSNRDSWSGMVAHFCNSAVMADRHGHPLQPIWIHATNS